MTTKTLKNSVPSVKLDLLGLDNPKLQKLAMDSGYIVAGLSLAPHTYASKETLCPNAERANCFMHCLFFTGRGGFADNVKNARIRKTKLFVEEREYFMGLLITDIMKLQVAAKRLDRKLAIRLNMFSDINWTGVYYQGKTVFEHFPEVTFYDYTKVPRDPAKLPANYKLTFSYSPEPAYQVSVKKALRYGMNIAVVFQLGKGEALPAIWNGKTVINGDLHDLRFLDPENVIIGLKEKTITDPVHKLDKRQGLAVKAA